MSKIQILSDLDVFDEIKDFLTRFGYNESFTPVTLQDTHFFVINRASQSYELSNVTKRIKNGLDATSDKLWQPKLSEFLLESAYLEPYFIRIKPSLFRKVEMFRAENGGISKSAIGNIIFSEFFKNK